MLAQQWLRYRYGVFEETGELGSPLHPPHYRTSDASFHATSCSNVPLKENLNCKPEDVSCQANIEEENNPGLRSSFMAHPELEEVSIRFFISLFDIIFITSILSSNHLEKYHY